MGSPLLRLIDKRDQKKVIHFYIFAVILDEKQIYKTKRLSLLIKKHCALYIKIKYKIWIICLKYTNKLTNKKCKNIIKMKRFTSAEVKEQ